jgi:CRP/FNR family transcriptional regulator, cyclic AMP receptor protein
VKEPQGTTRVDELRTIPLFSRLSSADLQFLATKLGEIRVPAGTTLITEGMGNHAFFLLAHGEVDVFVGGTHRRTLGPNDFFGEISMMVLDPATATVVTRTPVRAYVMRHSQFLEVRVHETVMLHLKSAMGDRLAADRRLVP